MINKSAFNTPVAKLLAPVLTLLLASSLWAQGGKIVGKVIDKDTGEPLPGVNVVVDLTEMGAATDETGEYLILNIPPGVYTMRAQMIGYSTVVQSEVRISIDLTTTVDFEPQVEAIAGEEVTVVAQRPVVIPDIAGSERNIDVEEIAAGRYQNISHLVTAQVGVSNISSYSDRPGIRGSGFDEALFIVDGVAQGDPLTNRPSFRVNLDAVQEVKVQTGGFLAEYGNLRSGIVNVVTKSGGDIFTGSVNIQYSQPGLKHFGPMIFGHKSPLGIPFVDPDAGAFSGTDKDGNENIFFEGWDAVANKRLKEGDPHYQKPGEAYARWLWRHRSKDSIEKLKKLAAGGKTPTGETVNIKWGDGVKPDDEVFHQTGVVPDYRASFTLGGPIPVLPRTTFFLTYNQEQMEYAYRPPQRAYIDKQFSGKLTTWLSDKLKLNLHGFWSRDLGGDGGQGPGINGWVSNSVFRSVGSENKFWYPHCAVTGQQTRQIYGLNLTNTASANTFWELRFSHLRSDYEMLRELRNTAPMPGTTDQRSGRYGEAYAEGLPTSAKASGVVGGRIGTDAQAEAKKADGDEGWENWREWAKIKIGDHWYDEAPRGYGPVNWRDITGEYRMESCNLRNNETYSRSYDLSASVTSQVNRSNQVKGGVQVRFDRIFQLYEQIDPSVNAGRIIKADVGELRGSIYVQDKLEYQGFVANLGLRADWIQTGEYPVLDFDDVENDVSGPYSQFTLPGNTLSEEDEKYNGELTGFKSLNTFDEIPLKRVTHTKLSPRLGISHPITTVAKIFFNYGHMYQWPEAYDRYRIRYDTRKGNRIDRYGNPGIDPPRTIQYELGYEHNLFDKMSLRITGYYKDVNNDDAEVRYRPIGHGSDYRVTTNQRFRDIRGLEAFLELRRNVVPFVSGWASANYLVESSGKFGFDRFYEDPTRQTRQVSSQVSNPDVRPVIRVSLNFHTPDQFGPSMGTFSALGGINANLLYNWKRGSQFTWNPGKIKLVEDNLRWGPEDRFDFRFTKNLFSAGNFQSVFYLDVTNLFNNKNMTKPRKILGKSGGRSSRGNSVSLTDDEWAWSGHKWWKKQVQKYLFSLGYTSDNQKGDGSGEFSGTKGQPGDWDVEGIELPGFTPWLFLEKRDIYFGIKFYF